MNPLEEKAEMTLKRTVNRALHTRNAREEDKDFVYALNRIVYREVVIQQFGGWNESGQRQYFEEKWARAAYHIVEYKNAPAGVLWVTEHPEKHVLHEIQLLPAYQGRGIGTTLLRRAIAHAHAHHVPLQLRVLTHNIRAQQLYTRLGFVISATTDTHRYMEYPVPTTLDSPQIFPGRE